MRPEKVLGVSPEGEIKVFPSYMSAAMVVGTSASTLLMSARLGLRTHGWVFYARPEIIKDDIEKTKDRLAKSEELWSKVEDK